MLKSGKGMPSPTSPFRLEQWQHDQTGCQHSRKDFNASQIAIKPRIKSIQVCINKLWLFNILLI